MLSLARSVLFKFREHLINAGSFIFLRAASLGLFVISTPFFLREAGEEKYGALTMLLVLFNFLGYLDLGTGYASNLRYVRALARQKSRNTRNRLLRRALSYYVVIVIWLVASGLLAARHASLALFSNDLYEIHMQILFITLAILILEAFFSSLIRAHNKVFQNNVANFIFDVFRNLALVVGALSGGNLVYTMLAVAAGALLRLIYSVSVCYFLEEDMSWLWPEFHWKEFRFNLGYGLPMMLTAALGILMHNIDRVLIGKFIALTDLTYYSIASDVNTKAWFLVYAINTSLYTVFIRRKSRNESARALILLSLSSVLAIGLFYYVPLSLFASSILALWLNPEIARASADLVRLHAAGSVLYLAVTVFYGLLQAQGKARQLFIAYLLGVAILAGLLLTLPRWLGVAGYALSYIILYASLLALLVFFTLKGRSVSREEAHA